LAAGVERLDEDHAAAATWARCGECGLRSVISGSLVFVIDAFHLQERPSLCKALLARATGEEAVVADGWKPLGRTWMRKRRMNSATARVMVV
jgi:hypothetical protein